MEAMDRISSLPLDIIHDHIFPFLSSKDIKVTTSLSKTWYNISNSFPQFDFHDYGLGSGFGEEEEEEEEDKYLNHVGQTLQRFHDNSYGLDIIRRLNIPLIFSPRVAPLLDSWIALVLQHGVHDLNIKIAHPKQRDVNRPYYDLPQAIFEAKSMIKVATFTGCSLLHYVPNYGSTNLLMRKLCLQRVLLDKTTISCIISSCPLIEELSLSCCTSNLNCLQISNLHSLKALEICDWNHITVEINAPKLQNLEIQGSHIKISILGSCPNLTDLRLKHVHESALQDILPRLPFLRSLCLMNHTLNKLKVSSDTLNKLTILGCKNIVELNIDAPNLLSVIYKGSHPPLLACSSTHFNLTSARWYVTTGYGVVNLFRTVEDCLVEFSNFASKIKRVEHLELNFDEPRGIDLSRLKGRVVHPPVANIANLKLCLQTVNVYKNCLLDANCIFDAVLWSYRPRTLSMQIMVGNKDYVLHICLVILHHRGDPCSCTINKSNWLHRLEDVIHVTKCGKENRLPMDGTFVPNVHSLFSLYDEIKFIFKW